MPRRILCDTVVYSIIGVGFDLQPAWIFKLVAFKETKGSYCLVKSSHNILTPKKPFRSKICKILSVSIKGMQMIVGEDLHVLVHVKENNNKNPYYLTLLCWNSSAAYALVCNLSSLKGNEVILKYSFSLLFLYLIFFITCTKQSYATPLYLICRMLERTSEQGGGGGGGYKMFSVYVVLVSRQRGYKKSEVNGYL